MEKVLEKERCTGCTSCQAICPVKAITMEIDSDGFKYPKIDQEKCIQCGLCQRTCPVLNTKENQALNKCYVGYAKDEKIRKTSSSGGIFSLIANYFLSHDGIVVGAYLDKKHLKHIAITKKEELDKLKGSKYLQSDLENIFDFVKNNLSQKKILFVGTPCQIAGLKSVIKKNIDNLLCLDIICHGVVTPKLFIKYVEEIEKKNEDYLVSYNFRDKENGWENYQATLLLQNKKISERAVDNPYMKLFLSDIALRRSCYQCNFKLGNKYSDITLGDFWGVKKIHPEMYNKLGVSAIIINTEFGKTVFQEIQKEITFKECMLEDILKENASLKISSKKPKKREEFFQDLNKLSVGELEKKYVKKHYFKQFIKKLLGR